MLKLLHTIGGGIRNLFDEVDGVLTGHEAQIQALAARVASLESLVKAGEEPAPTSQATAPTPTAGA